MNKYRIQFKSKGEVIFQHCLIQNENPQLTTKKLAMLYCITQFAPTLQYFDIDDELTVTCEIV